MRTRFTPVLLILAACEPEEADVEVPSETGDSRDHVEDTADTDSGEDTDGETGAGETADTRETSTSSDTGCSAVTLRSDDAVSSGGCSEVIPICAAGSCTLDIHLDTVTISGTIADVDVESGRWRLLFEDPILDIDGYNQLGGSGWGTYVPFGTVGAWVSDTPYTARVFPGVYDLALEKATPGNEVSQHFPVAASYVLAGDTTLDIDLPFHTVSGVVRLNGTDFAPISSTLTFEDATTGSYARFSLDRSGAYEALLPDGTWDVTFSAEAVSGLGEGEYDVGIVEVAGADVTADVDVEAYTVGGSILLAGAPLPEYSEDASWLLRFVDEGGRTMDTYVHEGDTWSVALPPGTWDAWIANEYLMGTDILVSGPTTADLAEQTVDVTGTLLVDGAPPRGWSLVLRDPESGIAYWADGLHWSAAVHPGVYDVYVSSTTGSGTKLIDESVEIAASATLDYTVATAGVSGAVSWNGGVPPEDWWVVFVDTASGQKSVATADRGPGLTWDARLPTGVYDVYVRFDISLPEMYVPLIRGLSVDADVCLDLEVDTYPVGGTVLLNGAAPAGGDDIWAFVWNDEATGDTMMEHLDGTASTWSVDLPAGVYTFLASFDVLDEEGTYNHVPVLTCVQVGPS